MCPSQVCRTHLNLLFHDVFKLSYLLVRPTFNNYIFAVEVSMDLCCNFIVRASEMLQYSFVS